MPVRLMASRCPAPISTSSRAAPMTSAPIDGRGTPCWACSPRCCDRDRSGRVHGVEDVAQLVGGDGLDQVVIEAGLAGALAIGFHAPAGERDHDRMGGGGERLDVAADLDAV